MLRAIAYDLARTVAGVRPHHLFDVSCDGSVPEAVLCFLESRDHEGAVRLAVSLGGDADTQAAIAGGIAEAYHGGVAPDVAAETRCRLPPDLRDVLDRFTGRFVKERMPAVAE